MSFASAVDGLRTELSQLLRDERPTPDAGEAWNVLVVAYLRHVLSQLAAGRGASSSLLAKGRLFRQVPGFEADGRELTRQRLLDGLRPVRWPELAAENQPLEAFGQLYESLLAARPRDGATSLRKRTGSYYTPEALTELVVERAFSALETLVGPGGFAARRFGVLDPALGAGAFLVQAGRELSRRSGRTLADVVQRELYGVDISPLAVAVAEASLWLLAAEPELSLAAAGEGLREGDALVDSRDGPRLGQSGVALASLRREPGGFDLVVGNPPWVAFAGRATQPLPAPLREHYRRSFRAFRGYPTLHAMFVERSAEVAPRGVVALLVPSPLADLDGYRPARAALAETHAVCEPLLELGQDAFVGVTQPSFVLLAVPRSEPAREPEREPERAFVLSERQRALASAAALRTPPCLARTHGYARLPPELFGEMGLQTTGAVTRELLYRGSVPPAEFSYALLEGRNVAEFSLRPPRLFLKPDAQALARHRCRLRDPAEYQRVKLVVRQTAAITIAAAHDGTPFRNSLLAGFELADYPHLLTLGLLNSTLYRALHLASRRDARQGAFPQVKVNHLRSLPAPPAGASRGRIALLAGEATQRGLTAELRAELDRAVFEAFELSAADAEEVSAFVRELAPAAGLTAPLA